MKERGEIALALRHISYAVAGVSLLHDVSLSVRRGVCTALLGPNGAGKTLLMKIAHGLIAPSGGEIIWTGDTAPHVMVAQKPLMMRRSVHANLVHALALAGLGYSERHARAAETLRGFRLDHLADRPATRLSGGEQQRVAIARAAALNPDVIFLDEPTAALDPSATREIEAMIGLLTGRGVTILLASHDLPQARRLASDVAMFHKGRLVEAGGAAAFFDAPRTPEARTFLAGDLLL